MAAQTFETKYFRSPAVFAANFPGKIERSATLDLDTIVGPDGTDATPLEANDVIKLFKLPQGVKLIDGEIECEDLDDAASLTLQLGVTDGTTTKSFFSACTIGQTGGLAYSRDAAASTVLDAFDSDAAAGFVTTNGDFYLFLKCVAAAGTPNAADGVRVSVGYTLCTEVDEANRSFPSPIPT